jgi:hypothetical protein
MALIGVFPQHRDPHSRSPSPSTHCSPSRSGSTAPATSSRAQVGAACSRSVPAS